MSIYGERIATLEVEMREQRKSFDDFKHDTNVRLDSMDAKLDELLELRNKGAGIFLVVSGIIGTGVMGVVYAVIQWFRG